MLYTSPAVEIIHLKPDIDSGNIDIPIAAGRWHC
jgi:hypothetical protein